MVLLQSLSAMRNNRVAQVRCHSQGTADYSFTDHISKPKPWVTDTAACHWPTEQRLETKLSRELKTQH